MQLNRRFRIAAGLFLCFVAGCCLHKPITPVVQSYYVDQGGVLQWNPTGKPFQIYSIDGNPCYQDNLVSDGKTAVICHAYTTLGPFRYTVGKPGLSKDQLHSGAASSTVNTMHVGQCVGCPTTPLMVVKPESAQVAADAAVPAISGSTTFTDPPTVLRTCPYPSTPPAPATQPTLDTSQLPTLHVKDNVFFQDETGGDPMTLIIDPYSQCSNTPLNSTKVGNTYVISRFFSYCTLSTATPFTAGVTTNGCMASKPITFPVQPAPVPAP
jgi:hypothetical protein